MHTHAPTHAHTHARTHLTGVTTVAVSQRDARFEVSLGLREIRSEDEVQRIIRRRHSPARGAVMINEDGAFSELAKSHSRRNDGFCSYTPRCEVNYIYCPLRARKHNNTGLGSDISLLFIYLHLN